MGGAKKQYSNIKGHEHIQDPRGHKFASQPSGIDKFNSSVIDSVIKEVMAEINQKN